MVHKIIIEAIPHEEQRYDTLGDWFFDTEGALHICVSAKEGESIIRDEQFLIALHELIEVKLCHKRGISQKAVDEFDFQFEGDGEPGDHPEAPYRKEHRAAMLIEHQMAHFLGLDDYGRVE